LIFDKKRKVLLVKPSYKDRWLIPGGVVNKNESPREAAIRETKEEIDLDLDKVFLRGVLYGKNDSLRGESLQFFFGTDDLSEKDKKRIKVDGEEITDYGFFDWDEARKKGNFEITRIFAKKKRPEEPLYVEKPRTLSESRNLIEGDR